MVKVVVRQGHTSFDIAGIAAYVDDDNSPRTQYWGKIGLCHRLLLKADGDVSHRGIRALLGFRRPSSRRVTRHFDLLPPVRIINTTLYQMVTCSTNPPSSSRDIFNIITLFQIVVPHATDVSKRGNL